jgi:hypothetical protein
LAGRYLIAGNASGKVAIDEIVVFPRAMQTAFYDSFAKLFFINKSFCRSKRGFAKLLS